MLCLKGKMIGVTTFETDGGKKLEIVFTKFNRPPIDKELYISLIDKGNFYLLEDFVLV